jgi:hypothetical protein
LDYIYENLGDERFQEFCSCLISKEFPNVQTFPVGQPDGGRDSLVYLMNDSQKEFIVFQVKFVRNANHEKDIHKWLTEVIAGEAEKIEKLIPKGAKGYYLLTNVRSTGHLENGAKDKINKILESSIKVPSICWWREDLSMLFEKDPIFKWSFPEIINGQDILNSVLFNNINENRERRENVIRAYLSDQYEMDNEVKFRQINLQNGLYDLYTDVPIQVKNLNPKNKGLKLAIETIENSCHRKLSSTKDNHFAEETSKMGAAEFLLHPQVQGEISQILLEGGPGQGKSTISQYVSQVHRSRLLNKASDIAILSDKIKFTPVRLPFKVDLRHIATWIEKKNPYIDILSDDYFMDIWHKSLEAFLVGHIYFHSKLEQFNTNDLISICRLSSILFVFDGFDEIANLEVRAEVIEFINKGINRISINSKSIQVIITSRPAAFTDSIGFSEDTYPHFELTDITSINTEEYLEKWIKASRLNAREASEIRKLVKEKLELPHLKELAKSPMQLAIFISLLRTDGESLPNKRTVLYDSYIRLFFNRESEKNTIIRDYRDLIIEIHEYLAWILHSEAELLKNSGTIHIEDLKNRLNEYLRGEGHQTEITDKLFQVVKERVCALVSRVQGTFEFEVQPLREYFCAKYLYKTKPYSPIGSEKPGTLPDRFDAISHNFYWQNVVRFFAGCFDKGELSMLIQKLKELVDDNTLKYTNYPRIITSQLLSDYVFAQYPTLLKDVVKIIIDGINIGNIINQEETSSNNERIILPTECGRTELVDECFRQLVSFPANDYTSELIGLIKNNPDRVLERWKSYLSNLKEEKLILWLEYAYRLGIIHLIDEEVLLSIISSDDFLQVERKLQIIINGNRLDFIDKNLELKKHAYNAVLASNMHVLPRNREKTSLEFLTITTMPFLIGEIFRAGNSRISLISFLRRYFPYSKRNEDNTNFKFNVNDPIDMIIDKFSGSVRSALESDLTSWRNRIDLWDVLIENGRTILGDCWSLYIISTIAANVKSDTDRDDKFSDIGDLTISLCRRARFARLKSGNVKYWEEQLLNNENIMFKLLILFTWATPKTIMQLEDTLFPILESLDKVEFIMLVKGIEKSCQNSIFNKIQKNYIVDEIYKRDVQDSLIYLLAQRFDLESKGKFICDNIFDDNKVLDEINEFKIEYLIKEYLMDTANEGLLLKIKRTYSQTKIFDNNMYYLLSINGNKSVEIPYDIAKKIMEECKEFPKFISYLAEKSCKIYALKNVRTVGEIAKNEKWFVNQ